MRIMKSTWQMAVAVLGGTGLIIGGVALAQQPLVVEPPTAKNMVTDNAAAQHVNTPNRFTPQAVPVLSQVPYVQNLIAFQSAGEAQDPQLVELAQLDAKTAQETQQLIDQYATATDYDDRSKLKDQLAQSLERQFDAQQELRELEVSRVEARVKKLRDLIAKRNEAKRAIVDKRLDQLIRDAEGLGWTSQGTAAGPAIQYQRVYSGPPGATHPVPVTGVQKQ